MQRRPSLTTILVLAPILSLAARTAFADPTSERYAFSTYREEAGRVTVFADGYPASMGGNTSFIPISVAIAMTKSGKSVAFAPESFALLDAEGHAYPAATYQELIKGYDKLKYDVSLISSRPIAVGTYITELRELEARFYPPRGSGTRTLRVELGPFTWFNDVLYFPRPPAGLGGVLTLRVAMPGADSIAVRFEVPRQTSAKH
jgi:hypothetical protein